MTITDAVHQIRTARPALTFKIGLEVWHHEYQDGSSREDVRWDIWDADAEERTEAPTLEAAVEAFLCPSGSLAEVEAATAQMPVATWAPLAACLVCGAARTAGLTHTCPTAFQQAEAARRGEGAHHG